jgi:uncharacterized protein
LEAKVTKTVLQRPDVAFICTTFNQQYFLKLNPPHASFMMEMSDDEKATMQKHVVYWTTLLNDGIVIVFGPVMMPNGGYGAGVVSVDNENT